MDWEVEFTDQFAAWWDGLTETEQEAITAAVQHLQERGPGLGRPFVDTIKGSRFSNLKELRPWYREMIPVADALYEEHLRSMAEEG